MCIRDRPMIVRHPALEGATVSDDLVTLTDITATMVSLAGRTIPSYLDARPLTGLGLAGERREYVFGALQKGWMLYDGEWKLCKYPNGAHLFNLHDDPTEQHNRARDTTVADIFHRLDAQLTHEIMRSTDEATFAGRVSATSNSSSRTFGRPGHGRTYPTPWNQTYGD